MCVCKGMAHRHSATSWAFRPPRQKVSQLALRTSSGDSLGPGDPPLLTGHVMRGHVVVRPRPQARAAARWGPAFAPEVPAFVRQLLARWRRWRWWRRQRARSKMALRPGTGTGGGGAAGAGAGAPGGGRWVRRAGSEHPHLHRGVDLGGYGGFRECRPFSFELGYGRRGVRSLRGLRRGPGAGRLYSKLRATCCLGGRAGAGGKRRGARLSEAARLSGLAKGVAGEVWKTCTHSSRDGCGPQGLSFLLLQCPVLSFLFSKRATNRKI
jgi:hypothetical protein